MESKAWYDKDEQDTVWDKREYAEALERDRLETLRKDKEAEDERQMLADEAEQQRLSDETLREQLKKANA